MKSASIISRPAYITADAAGTPCESTVVGRTRTVFLRHLFRLLDDRSVRYCVLHSWTKLPNSLPSDLDICAHPDDRNKIAAVFGELRTSEFYPIQCFHYSAGAFYFVFGWYAGDEVAFVCVDMIFEHWRSGLCVPDIRETITSRKRHNGFWTAAPDAEFCYLLAKRAWKRSVSPAQAERMKTLAEMLGVQKTTRIAGQVFATNSKQGVVAGCFGRDLSVAIHRARRISWFTSFVRHPLNLAHFMARDVYRQACRWNKPTGLLVAILGTDGAGKSTLIEHLDSQVGPAFRRTKRFHWAPRVIVPNRQVAPNTDPHAKPVRSSLISCCFLLAFVADYWLGYLASIRSLRARSCLILFDRYFHDVLVDPQRYRYGGPAWFARWMTRFVPSPDLVVILDADEHAIAARKAELPPNEIARQRREYKSLRFPHSQRLVANTGRGENLSLHEVSTAIFEHLARRFENRHTEWLPDRRPQT